MFRERTRLVEIETEPGKLFPFTVRGLLSVLMHETVRDYCQAEGITFTRCHPYRKVRSGVGRTEERRGGASAMVAAHFAVLAMGYGSGPFQSATRRARRTMPPMPTTSRVGRPASMPTRAISRKPYQL